MYAMIQGKQIHYDILGTGSPVLLVHGWGGSMESMRPLAEQLSKKHKTIIVDLPGFGQSQLPDPEWGIEEYTDILITLLDELKIKNVTYFGHSFGGSLGIWLAAKKSTVIERLILCDASFKRKQKQHPLARALHYIQPLRNKTLRMMFYRICFPSSDLARYPELEQNFRKIVKHDLSELPKNIKKPTLILWGAQDTVTPVSWANELHEQIDGSKLKIIEGARHGLPLRQPELVADEVSRFLSS